MALVPATLAAGLSGLSPTDKEAVAINTIATAYTNFMSTAMAGPIPIIPAGLQAAKTAMIGAMSGLSNQNNGAQSIANGVNAFWGVMAGAAAALFPTATSLTPPPTVSLIATALPGVFASNVSGKLDLASCANTVAAVIASNSLGGIAIFPPAPGGIGPQPIT